MDRGSRGGSDFFTYATKSYVRVDNNPATRGDVKAACRLVPVTAVGYANPSKPTVTLKSAPKCLKWRSSADDGKTYSKWKSVTKEDADVEEADGTNDGPVAGQGGK